MLKFNPYSQSDSITLLQPRSNHSLGSFMSRLSDWQHAKACFKLSLVWFCSLILRRKIHKLSWSIFHNYITAICYSYLSQLELLITVKLTSTQIQREHDNASRKIGWVLRSTLISKYAFEEQFSSKVMGILVVLFSLCLKRLKKSLYEIPYARKSNLTKRTSRKEKKQKPTIIQLYY